MKNTKRDGKKEKKVIKKGEWRVGWRKRGREHKRNRKRTIDKKKLEKSWMIESNWQTEEKGKNKEIQITRRKDDRKKKTKEKSN